MEPKEELVESTENSEEITPEEAEKVTGGGSYGNDYDEV
jgi:hypothetical protein